jgi:hypothetical protein
VHPWTTNKSTQTLDDCRFSFESTGALAVDNEYSGFAVAPAHYIAAYFGERDRRFRERDRFGGIGVARYRL